MDSKLLDYYNRELAYLRELGAEFAARYPKVAGRLGMSSAPAPCSTVATGPPALAS